MALESATYLNQLVATNPTGTDQKAQGDDHIRLLKAVLQATFPNINGAVNPTPAQLNYLVGVTSLIQEQLNARPRTVYGTFTTAALAAEAFQLNAITHGLGTDNVAVIVVGNGSNGHYWTVTVVTPSYYTIRYISAFAPADSKVSVISAPASGIVNIYTKNADASTQTVTVKYWITAL